MDFIKSSIIGKVDLALTSKADHPLITQPVSALEVTLEGIVGDRHFGFIRPSGVREKNQFKKGTMISNHRQWSAVSKEELDDVAVEMGINSIPPESIAANLVIQYIPFFSDLPPFTRLVFQGSDEVVLVVYEMNKPCDIPMPYIKELGKEPPKKRFSAAAKGKRGLVGWVEKAGKIQSGNKISVWLPKMYPGIQQSPWL